MAKLARNIGFGAGFSLLVGGVIGSGIFMKPAVMTLQLGSPSLMLLVWLMAGVVVLCGALCNAEAGAMFPETGGQYVLFQKMYGDRLAFLYGWASFAVFNTAGIASIAYICAEYLLQFLNFYFSSELKGFLILGALATKILASLLLVVFTILNALSVRQSGLLQEILTAMKLLAIFIFMVGLMCSDKGNMSNVWTDSLSKPQGWPLFMAFMASFAGAFWAFDGWNSIVFVAGEIKEPQKNIPRILISGILICTLVYCLTSMAFVYVVPVTALTANTLIASEAARTAFGSFAAALVIAMVAFSTVGSLNSNVLSTARITFALGHSNRHLHFLSKIHPRFSTPHSALVANLVLAILYVFSGTFDSLTDMLIFVSWLFYGLGAYGIFILRKRYPQHPRSFKTPLYPVLPIVFVMFTSVFLLNTLFTDIYNYMNLQTIGINSLYGIGITLLGLPLHYLANKK